MKFKFQFSLIGLLVAMATVAFASVALTFASAFWASTTFTVGIGLLLFSSLAALFCRRDSRAFAIGFLIFGCAYLLLVFGPWFSGNIRDRLLTSRVLAMAHSKVGAWAGNNSASGTLLVDFDSDSLTDLYVVGQSNSGQIVRNQGNGKFTVIAAQGAGSAGLPVVVGTSGPPWEEFQQIGHSLFTMLLAVIGGFAARGLWRWQHFSDANTSAVGPLSANVVQESGMKP